MTTADPPATPAFARPTAAHRIAAALAGVACALIAATPAAATSSSTDLLPLATCQESWLDWKAEPERARVFVDALRSRFEQSPRSPDWKPRVPTRLLDQRVLALYPDSVGMGVGFSVELAGAHETVRTAFEAALGRPMTCQDDEGMRSCELEIGERRTAILFAPLKGERKTMVGCYYFYQP